MNHDELGRSNLRSLDERVKGFWRQHEEELHCEEADGEVLSLLFLDSRI